MEEIWKVIEDYPNYMVSSMGRVKSLNYNHTGKEKVLKPLKDKYGYLRVHLCKNIKVKDMLIHRLVAQAFIPNPDNLPQINHKDEIKTNNYISNLEYCTAKYNVHYSHVWEKSKKVCNKPVLQFTKEGEFVAEYPSASEAGRQSNIRQGNISRCCRGEVKSSGGFIWRYK